MCKQLIGFLINTTVNAMLLRMTNSALGFELHGWVPALEMGFIFAAVAYLADEGFI